MQFSLVYSWTRVYEREKKNIKQKKMYFYSEKKIKKNWILLQKHFIEFGVKIYILIQIVIHIVWENFVWWIDMESSP